MLNPHNIKGNKSVELDIIPYAVFHSIEGDRPLTYVATLPSAGVKIDADGSLGIFLFF